MNIDLTCQKCEGEFELDATDLIEGEEKLVCPHCDAKLPKTQADDFVEALSTLIDQIENVSKKFGVSVTLESDDLPGEDEEDEEDDDEDDSDEDDESDDDGDEDDDDLDDDDEDEDDEKDADDDA